MRLLSFASRTYLAVLTLTACDPIEPPPEEPDVQRCCENNGTCLALQGIDPNMLALLDIDQCAQGALCVPDQLLWPLPARRCTQASTGAEGRCLPACLLEAEQLQRDGCAAHERCMPCYDRADGAATGACSISSDHPREPPLPSAECSDASGRCTPGTSTTASHPATAAAAAFPPTPSLRGL